MTRHNAAELVEKVFATADAEQRIAAADAQFLDTFLALHGEARAARWRQLDGPSKWRLVARMIERLGYEWTDEAVAHWIAKYDAQWEVGDQAASDRLVPAAAEILTVVKERIDTARQHGDYAGVRQLDRLRANLIGGARLSWSLGDLLIQSVNNPGAVYSVDRCSCSCPNGAAGRSSCWHVALYDLLLDMQEDRAAEMDAPGDEAPVDDGPEDNWGGFRAPSYAVITVEREVITLGARIARARRALEAA